jgi:hypothetical protein
MRLNLFIVALLLSVEAMASGVEPVLASRVVLEEQSNNDVQRPTVMEVVEPERRIVPVDIPVETDAADRRVIAENKPEPVVIGNLTIYHDGRAAFAMSPGLLKPQLTELLLTHGRVKSVEWFAEDNLMWANDFVVSGETIEHVINKILAAYRLRGDVKGNDVVTVRGINK